MAAFWLRHLCPRLALLGPEPMSGLSPEAAPKRTSADQEFCREYCDLSFTVRKSELPLARNLVHAIGGGADQNPA
jgi:hypothetical protein